MSRRQRAVKRETPSDPKYGSAAVTKFINALMVDGKKSVAEGILYESMRIIEEKTGQPALNVFEQALNNVKPVVEVKSRRVGGATYQVPVQIEGQRRQSLAIRWLLASARARAGKTMQEKLANELLDAYNGTGATIKKREDTHRMAEANRAFSHFRF